MASILPSHTTISQSSFLIYHHHGAFAPPWSNRQILTNLSELAELSLFWCLSTSFPCLPSLSISLLMCSGFPKITVTERKAGSLRSLGSLSLLRFPWWKPPQYPSVCHLLTCWWRPEGNPCFHLFLLAAGEPLIPHPRCLARPWCPTRFSNF